MRWRHEFCTKTARSALGSSTRLFFNFRDSGPKSLLQHATQNAQVLCGCTQKTCPNLESSTMAKSKSLRLSWQLACKSVGWHVLHTEPSKGSELMWELCGQMLPAALRDLFHALCSPQMVQVWAPFYPTATPHHAHVHAHLWLQQHPHNHAHMLRPVCSSQPKPSAADAIPTQLWSRCHSAPTQLLSTPGCSRSNR